MPMLEALRKRFPTIKFVTKADAAFLKSCHIDPETDNVACRHCGQLVLTEAICLAFKVVREAWGHPIQLNSGCRCEAYQEALREGGARAAKISPHTFGTALDVDVPDGISQEDFAKFILKVLKSRVRVGYRAYAGQGFVHMDVAFVLKPNPVPSAYAPGVTW